MAIIDTFLLLSICANLSMSRKTELHRSPIRAFSVGRPVLNCLKEKREKLSIAAAIHSFSRIGLVFCRPPTRSSIWTISILLHHNRVFLLPANVPAQSPASISDCRCKPHQRDDALFPVHIISAERASVNLTTQA